MVRIKHDEKQCILERLRVEHITFVDACGYSPDILMSKALKPGPSLVEVFNDRHHHVVNLFRVWRDEKKRKVFLKICERFTDAAKERYAKEVSEYGRFKGKDEKQIVDALSFFLSCAKSMKGISGALSVEMAKFMRHIPSRLGFLTEEPARSIYFRWMTTQVDYVSLPHVFRVYNFPQVVFFVDLHDPTAQKYYDYALVSMVELPSKSAGIGARMIVRSPREVSDMTTVGKFDGSFVQINKALAESKIKRALW